MPDPDIAQSWRDLTKFYLEEWGRREAARLYMQLWSYECIIHFNRPEGNTYA